nr:hypothetical protein [Tanacetum cinerariifolium]
MGIRIPQSNVPSRVADEAITKEMHDRLGRATTTASSLAAEHGSGNISKTQTKATPSGLSSPRTSSEGGPGCHFTIGDSPIQARPKRLSNLPYEPPLGEEEQLKHKGRRAVIDSSDVAKPSLDAEDSPTQGMMIEELDKDKNVNLVQSKYGIKIILLYLWIYEIEKGVMRRFGFDLQQESSKKQKLDEQEEVQVDSDQEEDEMKKYMKIVPGKEIAIDTIPLATKPPVIIEWKIIKKSYPLTPITITKMLERKLQADHWNEMCYQLLRLMIKQQKKR